LEGISLAKHTKPDTSSAKSSAKSKGKKGTGPEPQKNDAGLFGKNTLAIAIVIGIVAIIAVYLIISTPQPTPPGQGTVVQPRVCANKTMSFVNDNLVTPGSAASFVSVDETRGIYEINISYQAKTVPVYTTKDCTLFLINPQPLDTTVPASGQGTVVPPAVCANTTMSYINDNLVLPNSTASLVSIEETKGMYVINTSYQAKTASVYMTKDCALLFMNPLSLDTPVPTPAVTQTPTQAPKKSARPVVDLYVMSFCPYGVQAETAIGPVVDLLGSKADIRIRYITTNDGTTVQSVQSLHGPSEAQEDLRQLCIRKESPDLYWKYLDLFNTRCYPVWQNATQLQSCRENVTATLGIRLADSEACAFGSDGLGLLKADELDAKKYSATASPTLFINGVKYAGARTPEAFKTAMCASFETAPAECATNLSSSAATSSSGGCG